MRKGRKLKTWQLRSIAVLALAFLSACSKEPAEKEPMVTVQVATAQQRTMQEIVKAGAVLFPINQAAITPKIASPVQTFFVNRGSKVRRGQLLAKLENRDLAAAKIENQGAFQQAEAEYQNATKASLPEELSKAEHDVQSAKQALDAEQKLYSSREDLFKQGALPRKDLDQAKVSLVQAQAQYDLAERHLSDLQQFAHQQQLRAAEGQLTTARGKYMGASAQLSYTEIRSPISGVIAERPVYAGETPPSGTPLLIIMDTSQIVARAHFPQDQAARIKPGAPATISAPEFGEVKGKVTIVSPALDNNSTTVEVWAQAPNPEGRMRPGTSVNLSITAATLENAIIIPAAALLKTPEGLTTVMLAGADGRAHPQEVDAGVQQGDEVQITKGLSAGQKVIVSGAYGLSDNTRIQVAEGPPENAAPEKSDEGNKKPGNSD